MIELNHYKYKEQTIKCTKCNWNGFRKELKLGEVFDELYELDCPSCYESLAYVPFPTQDEVLKFGSEKEKEDVKKEREWNKKVISTKLKNIQDLPDIEGRITIQFKEVSIKNEGWLELYANKQLVWKEMIHYEYYERFIELCWLFDNKYNSQINDIKYVDTVYLLGDKLSASEEIEACIEEIKMHYSNKNNPL